MFVIYLKNICYRINSDWKIVQDLFQRWKFNHFITDTIFVRNWQFSYKQGFRREREEFLTFFSSPVKKVSRNIVNQLSTQLTSIQFNWVKSDNDYWEGAILLLVFPATTTTPPTRQTFLTVPDDPESKDSEVNLRWSQLKDFWKGAILFWCFLLPPPHHSPKIQRVT